MMFYTTLFTSKRGPLAKIWLAAHWERKLTKAHVFECNLEASVRDIISPKMKIGLRTSGHLLIGVVRIYSKKAKYLLADCNDALIKIKTAFRPGQTDLPEEELEATMKAITLIEDFTAFDVQLPDLSEIDVVDHFALNQSRTEEITLKEDFTTGFLNLADFGSESQFHQTGLLDTSFQSLTQHGDAFGDEDKGFDILDFLTNSGDAETNDFIQEQTEAEIPASSAPSHQRDAEPTEAEIPTPSTTVLLANEDKAFALEPVAITPDSERKRGKRRRKLIVDQTKELTNEAMREQLSDYSDLVVPLDMAPPTQQLMLWKEKGGVDKLFTQTSSSVVAPQIKQLFIKSAFRVKRHSVFEEVEGMRQDEQKDLDDESVLTTNTLSVLDSSVEPEKTFDPELTAVTDENEPYAELRDASRSEVTQPELPSEDSMFVHPSFVEQDTPSTSLHTQSMLGSQNTEQRRVTRRAQKLVNTLKSSSDATFSLGSLCEGGSRQQAATTFYSFLILKKQGVLQLHQKAPYKDIIATPGPKFYN
ncbi:uncharacterized protein V6R79_025901 [Siganus canaliculatus]